MIRNWLAQTVWLVCVVLAISPPGSKSYAAEASPDLEWTIRSETNPMDRATKTSAVAEDRVPEAGARIEIRMSCRNSSLALVFSSFDAGDKPLPYELSGNSDNPYVNTRVKYNDETPQPFEIHLDQYSNSFLIEITGHALHSFAAAGAIMYELPLSNGERVYPVIRPGNPTVSSLLQPCAASADLEGQKRRKDQMQYELKQQEDARIRELCEQLETCVNGCMARSNHPRYFYGDACTDDCQNRYTSRMPEGACAKY